MSTVVPVATNSFASVLQPFVDSGTMAGAVMLAATVDRILGLEAVGYADVAARTPMTTDHLFWIASMTKPMTGTALMMLVDEGKLDVNDPVEKYLPEFRGQMVIAEKDDDHVLLKKPQHPILVREILNHTAGLHHYSPVEDRTFDRMLLEHAVRCHAISALQSEPGTKYSYSNAGTNTAGRIIEVLSGMSYEDFMQQRFFTPLGMTDTTFRPTLKQQARLAKVYRIHAEKKVLEETTVGQLAYPLDNPKRQPFPAGGLFSTATDCLEFCRMVLSGGDYKGRHYLSPAAIREMTTKQTGDAVEKAYGFGWSAENGTYGHGGAYKTSMDVHPELGLITIFLVQQASDWPNEEGAKIIPLFIEAAKEMAANAK